ncbi:WAP four-disulfide core domain protein 8-like isoform X2 [Tyto alba]|uniref:WAP four-disulfide core domain protein 8-like isoform X2 n=1 Tax=Tyto alba TaxID=56313 RepID=UPI001C677D1F|nr:WAP four-disulfide core domain protein 8-like isoform X2 [Tyto alba]
MELPPGRLLLLLLLLAALLPLAARSSPALHTVKPGYCYHNPEVEDPLDEDCGACRSDSSCSRCTGDAGCPGATKCCPSKCGYTCQEPVLDFCYLPSVCGSCKALFRRFFFNASSQQCEEFIYGGCGGNRNNFETEGECFQACSHVGKLGQCPPPARTPLMPCDVSCSSDADCPGSERCCPTGCGRECRLPTGAKPGVCPKRRVLHTFAPCNSSCSDDTDCPHHEKCCFTGCGLGCLPPARGTTAPLLPAGGGQRLRPAAHSSPASSGDICHLPPVRGPCRGRFRHYAYSPATGTCQPFTYSGCGGNPNNFRTVEECQRVCWQAGRAKE